MALRIYVCFLRGMCVFCSSLHDEAFRTAALVGAAPLAVLIVLSSSARLASAAVRNAWTLPYKPCNSPNPGSEVLLILRCQAKRLLTRCRWLDLKLKRYQPLRRLVQTWWSGAYWTCLGIQMRIGSGCARWTSATAQR